MLRKIIHGCSACPNEVTVDANQVFARQGSIFDVPGAWKKLGFEGGRMTIDLCPDCVAKILEACPKLRDTLKAAVG